MNSPDDFDTETTAIDELYNGEKFNNTLKSLQLEEYSLGLSASLSERKFVMAHVGNHGSPLYSKDKICCVYNVAKGEPIDIGPTGKSLSDILDEKPYKVKKDSKKAIPSLNGEYVKVMECSVRTDEDDIDYVRPKTPSYWIPIEWVRQRVYYDEEKTVLNT